MRLDVIPRATDALTWRLTRNDSLDDHDREGKTAQPPPKKPRQNWCASRSDFLVLIKNRVVNTNFWLLFELGGRFGLSIDESGIQVHLLPFGNFGKFVKPTLPASYGRGTRSHWSPLSAVYPRGSKIPRMFNLSWIHIVISICKLITSQFCCDQMFGEYLIKHLCTI